MVYDYNKIILTYLLKTNWWISWTKSGSMSSDCNHVVIVNNNAHVVFLQAQALEIIDFIHNLQ